MALPLAIIGWLALQTLQMERETIANRQSTTLTQQLQVAGESLRHTLDYTGDSIMMQMENTTGRGLQNTLRIMIMNGDVDVITVDDHGHRLFPVNPTVLTLWSDQDKFQKIDTIFAGLRTELRANPTLSFKNSIVRLDDSSGFSLFHCRNRMPWNQVVCIFLNQDHLQSILSRALIQTEERAVDIRLQTLFPGQAMPDGIKPDAVRELDHPLSGWQLLIWRTGTTPSPLPGWRLPLAVFTPLLISWLALAWLFHRSIQQRVELMDHRSELAAQLSHELRTPLANLRLYSGLIQRRTPGNHIVREYCLIMGQEIDRLNQLAESAVGSMLGKPIVECRMALGNPVLILNMLGQRLEPLLLAAQCRLVCQSADWGDGWFDVASFERIVINLLDNARKYACGSVIETTCIHENDLLHLTVRDHGPGVAPEECDRIFHSLVRGDGEAETGYGLGLAAVRRLSIINGGQAWCEPAFPGLRFHVTLAFSQQPTDTPCAS